MSTAEKIPIEPLSGDDLERQVISMIRANRGEIQPPFSERFNTEDRARDVWYYFHVLMVLNAARDKVLGILAYTTESPTCKQYPQSALVECLYVDPDQRRQHIAQLLVGALAQKAEGMGLEKIVFNVSGQQADVLEHHRAMSGGNLQQLTGYRLVEICSDDGVSGQGDFNVSVALFSASVPEVLAKTATVQNKLPRDVVMAEHRGYWPSED